MTGVQTCALPISRGVRAGESYVDVGTLNGYREAMTLLSGGACPSPRSVIGVSTVERARPVAGRHA